MGDVFMAICKYRGKSVILKLIDYLTLNDFRIELEKRWPGSMCNGGLMSYILPGNDDCQLETEDDYQNLRIMKGVFNLNHIEIFIQDTSREGSCSMGGSCDNMSLVDNGNQLCLEDVGMDGDMDDMRADIPILLCDPWKYLIKGVGQEFKDCVMFREALQKFSIKEGFDYRFLKNEKKRITAECTKKVDMGCMWRIHATSDSSGLFFYIREYIAQHTCVLGVQHRSSKRMSSDIVAKEVLHQIERFPLIKPSEIVKDFSVKYGVSLSYNIAYYGVEKARSNLFGNYMISYDQLRIYIERSMRCNPGSLMVLDVDEESKRFRRSFISYHASTEGFNYCRPMLFLDATFLTRRFRGQLLCSTAKDGNNMLYPVAFGIVDIEDEDNWTWFLRHLRIILKEGRGIVFVSDRHKGLLEAVANVFPSHPHSFCTIHIKANLKTKLSGKPAKVKESILKKFDQVAYSYIVERFQRKYEELKNSVGVEVAKWLDTLRPEHYSHAYFPGKRYEEMTSNAAESLNSKYAKIRQLPVYGLVDGIRTFLINDMTDKREASLKWKGLFTPNISDKIKAGMEFGLSWIVHKSSEGVYEVRAKKTVSVDLNLKTCVCNAWQTNSFPCAHAFAAMHRSNQELHKFIDPYYHNEMNIKAYALPVIPIDTIDMPLANLDDLKVLPPQCKRQPGRPKRKRVEGASDTKRQYQCGRCKGFGHNKKGCAEEAQD